MGIFDCTALTTNKLAELSANNHVLEARKNILDQPFPFLLAF
jgi:hypothetical protein